MRWGYIVRVVLVATVALVVLLPVGFGVLFSMSLTGGGCYAMPDPGQAGMAFEDVSFPSSEFNRPTPAYFIRGAEPARGGATIVVVPTGSAGRGDRWREFAVYHQHGYHVLTYDSRACVGNTGSTLGYREVASVSDALAYLATRPDVDAERIGLHGFSAGGATAIMAAARFPQVRALVAQGGYHDFAIQLEQNTRSLGMLGGLFQWGAHAAYRLRTGDDLDALSPIRVIGQIAPRPLLLIYGTQEPGLAGARQQLAAAGANAVLWEVPGAVHGNYLMVAPDEYAQRVTAFFDAALR